MPRNRIRQTALRRGYGKGNGKGEGLRISGQGDVQYPSASFNYNPSAPEFVPGPTPSPMVKSKFRAAAVKSHEEYPLNISVINLSGQELAQIPTKSTMSVDELRVLVSNDTAIAPHRQTLVHGKCTLTRGNSLHDEGLTDGTQITLVVRDPKTVPDFMDDWLDRLLKSCEVADLLGTSSGATTWSDASGPSFRETLKSPIHGGGK